ncbi:sulfurtransferase [Candidatus Fermentibacteria bacterium]|nr:MAG: sulfurtransferase [Candidatus Fermentibacteria bacterium]
MNFDVIIIGAGSVGTPAAMSLAERNVNVLVIESAGSAGQGNNKCAIGGIRATHSDPAKVVLSLHSLKTFSTWEEKHGDCIDWHMGGYTFVAYTEKIADALKAMIPGQQAAGLSINWHDADFIRKIVPGINPDGLLGGTFSPEDGSASPMESAAAFYRHAVRNGVSFRFNEKVTGISKSGSFTVTTCKGSYEAPVVVNCAGSFAREIGAMAGVDLPVYPDMHEGGISEPVQRFFEPMVVDIKKAPGSANYYFYQHRTGQVVFCITPDPPKQGTDTRETSEFLPMVAERMINLYPRLANLKVRRTWRGCYPQTPDGSPIIGETGVEGFLAAVGMCGQGYMLGPGVGEVIARLVTDDLTDEDRMVLKAMRLDREFSGTEALK